MPAIAAESIAIPVGTGQTRHLFKPTAAQNGTGEPAERRLIESGVWTLEARCTDR
jgi:hypothetical protein